MSAGDQYRKRYRDCRRLVEGDARFAYMGE